MNKFTTHLLSVTDGRGVIPIPNLPKSGLFSGPGLAGPNVGHVTRVQDSCWLLLMATGVSYSSFTIEINHRRDGGILIFDAIFSFGVIFSYGGIVRFGAIFIFGTIVSFGAMFRFGGIFSFGTIFDFGSIVTFCRAVIVTLDQTVTCGGRGENPPGCRRVVGCKLWKLCEEPVAVLEKPILVNPIELVPVQVGFLL